LHRGNLRERLQAHQPRALAHEALRKSPLRGSDDELSASNAPTFPVSPR
jgi:hypothetical protein